ncbi:MAG: PAS domain-containing protein [Desulfobacteraceae bacterium]|nr:PAS domain-containing protein [Desulfobacteraceae bacterium]
MQDQERGDPHQAGRLAALEREVRLCREVLAGSADGVLLVDGGLVVRWANQAVAAFTGQAMGDLIGRTCHQLFWGGEPCDGCPCLGGTEKGSQPEMSVLRAGRRLCRASGRAGDSIAGAVTIRGAADRATENEVWTRPGFPAETIPVPCHSLDHQGRLVAVNQAWLSLLGYRRDEVMGQPFAGFACPERRGQLERAFAFLQLRGEISGVETELRRKDGEPLPLLVEGRASFDEEGTFKRSTCILTPLPADRRPGAGAGLLPICSSCKKIRDKGGVWHNLEYYLHVHTRIEFSHGICPDCLPKLYPDFYK